jgi:hypothetical protein
MSSMPGAQGASERLVSLLLTDGAIEPLCIKALVTFSREEFEKQLRTSFEEFGIDLRKEAETVQQRRTGHFV